MKSKQLDIEQTIIDSRNKKLSEWLMNINELINLNNEDEVLYIKNNTRDVHFLISNDFNNVIHIQQSVIEENTSMTLKQWRECIEKLIRIYSKDYYLYLSESNDTFFYLSPMD